jgi:hypothetical protein
VETERSSSSFSCFSTSEQFTDGSGIRSERSSMRSKYPSP